MSNRVIDFKRDEWHTRQKLAELLDISVRTLYRRIDEGDIVVRNTPEGKRYRLADERDSKENAAAASAVPTGKSDTDDKEVAGELLGLLRDQLEQVQELRHNRGRLEAELEASQNDVTRAVDYVTQLEDELDRLDTRRAELADRLERERGRREELEELLEQAQTEIQTLTGERARLHMERGRREQAEQKCEDLRDEMTDLHRKLERLTHKLDDEQARRLKLALGSVSLEVRRSGEDD